MSCREREARRDGGPAVAGEPAPSRRRHRPQPPGAPESARIVLQSHRARRPGPRPAAAGGSRRRRARVAPPRRLASGCSSRSSRGGRGARARRAWPSGDADTSRPSLPVPTYSLRHPGSRARPSRRTERRRTPSVPHRLVEIGDVVGAARRRHRRDLVGRPHTACRGRTPAPAPRPPRPSRSRRPRAARRRAAAPPRRSPTTASAPTRDRDPARPRAEVRERAGQQDENTGQREHEAGAGPDGDERLPSRASSAISRTARPTSTSAPAASATNAQRRARHRARATSASTVTTASAIQNAAPRRSRCSTRRRSSDAPGRSHGSSTPTQARSSPARPEQPIRALNDPLVSAASVREAYVSITAPSQTRTRRSVPIASRNARSWETATIAPG